MMTMHASRTVLGVVCCLIAFNAFSAPDYRCLVDRRVTARPESSGERKGYENASLGKEFTVERQTGLMAGILKNSTLTRPQVIDNGSRDNSFKVITSMNPREGQGSGTHIYALTINEYESSDKKAFVFLANDVVYLGTCKHF